MANRAYAGGWWDWMTPFTVLTGLALLCGYALLGSTWLVMKTGGEVQMRSRQQAWFAGVGLLALMGAVSIWTPFLDPAYFQRWFAWPAILYSAIVPVLVLLCAWLLFTGLNAHRDRQPFLASLGIFVLSFVGLGISFYPNIVPPSLTIWEAASPDKSLAFLLAGAAVLIPIILAYTAFSYWVFRGKIDPDEGYH